MSRKPAARKPLKPKPSSSLPPPNFPQHELPAPYARLLTLGQLEEDDPLYEEIAAELKRGDAPTAAGKLAELALDETFYDYWEFYRNEAEYLRIETRLWVPLHAIRLLEHFGEAAAGVVESLLPLLDEEDDWLREELPFLLAAIGKPAIEPLARLLADSEEETMLRAGAGESLAELGEQHPEYRAEVVSILEQALMAETEDPTVAGFLVGSLMDLGAKESVPLIEQAFKEDRVDDTIVQMADVEEHFNLPRVTPRRAWDFFAEEDEDDEDEEEAEEWLPTSLPTLDSEGFGGREEQTPYIAPPRVGRNDLCPCGSGKKYKKCCGA